MLIIGLTGNIASGKSTVASALVARGATLVDSDVAARAAVAPGSPALLAIVQRFGADILQADGTLDRSRLGQRVFADIEARQALELILHPAIEAVRQAAIRGARERGDAIVICDIPLLFEARLAFQFARIILVDAPVGTRIARLQHTRGMTAADAEARVRAQLPATVKRGRADLVIHNDGSFDALTAQIAHVWSRLQDWAALGA
ncbi:MAG: dephospho-CoA kinase [Gemmatimonadaceae bacterium]|nr:dephospho-CoA kinase [Gemmatimonadaceae bacterium]